MPEPLPLIALSLALLAILAKLFWNEVSFTTKRYKDLLSLRHQYIFSEENGIYSVKLNQKFLHMCVQNMFNGWFLPFWWGIISGPRCLLQDKSYRTISHYYMSSYAEDFCLSTQNDFMNYYEYVSKFYTLCFLLMSSRTKGVVFSVIPSYILLLGAMSNCIMLWK